MLCARPGVARRRVFYVYDSSCPSPSKNLDIIVTTTLLYKKKQQVRGENLRGGHHETPSLYPALLGSPEHHDGVLYCSVWSVSLLWWLRGSGCCNWHWTELGRPSSPWRLPRISLWRISRAGAVASVNKYRAWGGCNGVVKITV